EKQKTVFSQMLSLAEQFGRPVSIHSRSSLEEVLAALPSYNLKGALLHWFAGSKKMLARAMDLGLYVSYGPPLIYSKDKQVLLRHSRRDRFLIETDGPVHYSHCFDGLPAFPTSFLATVAATASGVLNLSYSETVAIMETNVRSYLGT